MNFEKIGGLASILEVFLSVFLLVTFFILFPRLGLLDPSDWADPIKNMSAWESSPNTIYFFHIDFVLWGLSFVVLALSLRSRLWEGAPNLVLLSVIGASIAAALWLSSGTLGMIGKEPIVYAEDISSFRVITITTHCLTTAGYFVFGWVILLIGSAGIKTSKLSNILSWVLVVEGICFILNVAVNLLVVGLILAIISNLWLGIILIGSSINKDTEIEPQSR